MTKPCRIGVLGLTHDHVWPNLAQLAGCDRAVLVAGADPHQPLLDKLRQQHGCATYLDAEQLLAAEKLDAVYVFADNAGGAALATRAAERGLHVLIEKPMAANLAAANTMLAAAEKHHVRLMINWPFAWWPQLRRAVEIALAGELGDVWQVKYRAAHAGPRENGCSDYFCDWLFDPVRNGGGAMMDYCCYGALLASVLLGMPDHVTAVAARCRPDNLGVEDNAVLIMTYPRALATAEGSWSQIGKLTAYTTAIYGTKATLMVEPRDAGRLLVADHDHPTGVEISVPAPPAHLTSACEHFLWGIETGDDFTLLCDPYHGRNAQEILEAGAIAARTGEQVALPVELV